MASLIQRVWYRAMRLLCLWGVRSYLCLRIYRRERIPHSGAAVVLANHQSHFDPVLVGVTSKRILCFLARDTLFRGAFGWLIKSLGSIPVDREGGGMQGLRATLRQLQQQQAVLVFPEGTRTVDGQLGKIEPGFAVLVRRGDAVVVPVGIAGAFEAWPRNRMLPRPRRVTVYVGRAIGSDRLQSLDRDDMLALIQRRFRIATRTAKRLRERGSGAPHLLRGSAS